VPTTKVLFFILSQLFRRWSWRIVNSMPAWANARSYLINKIERKGLGA
jgi:hypothetical protein